jgi:hypothetical protein
MELAPISTGLDALTGAWLPEGGGSLAIEVSEMVRQMIALDGCEAHSRPADTAGNLSEIRHRRAPNGSPSAGLAMKEKAAAPERKKEAPPSLPAVSGGDTSEASEWPELNWMLTKRAPH